MHLDSDVTMTTHVTATVRACFAVLRQIRSVRCSLPRPMLEIAKVDYSSSVLVGVSKTQLTRLQSVLNAAARLVFSVRRSEHVTPLLRELHWLKVPERIQFRLCVLAYRCLHGTAPTYLADGLHLTNATESNRRLRSLMCRRCPFRRLAARL